MSTVVPANDINIVPPRSMASAGALKETANLNSSLPKPPKCYKPKWVYGYWFKNRHMRLLAEKFNLDWQGRALTLSFKLLDYVMSSTRVFCSLRAVRYRGQSALIMTFVEDDERRRLDDNEYSAKRMDRVRKAIGLPEGTKPKWYEVYGMGYDPNEVLDSEDEDIPIKPDENPHFSSEPNAYPYHPDGEEVGTDEEF